MFELRIHGRGGQGVFKAAELLALAAFAEGRHAQAFPIFGSEATGTSVISTRLAVVPTVGGRAGVGAAELAEHRTPVVPEHDVVGTMVADGEALTLGPSVIGSAGTTPRCCIALRRS